MTMSDEDCIIRVARALCAADGHDPRAKIRIGMEEVEDAADGERFREVTVPAWTSYVREARRMVVAVQALGLLE